jgi:hypothetical protein
MRNSSYSFTTSALDEGEWSAALPGRALPPGKWSPVPIVQEAGWAPQPLWVQRLEEKSSASAGDRIPLAQCVVRHYTDWATPALENYNMEKQNRLNQSELWNMTIRERNETLLVMSRDAVSRR